jgi:two-component system response regulator
VTHSPIEILLVEDSPSDQLITTEALDRAKMANRLHIAADGVEAIDFLRRKGKYAAAPRPDLILLDLNLPRKDGREVLAEVKSDPVLKLIPIAVLTSSAADEDVLKAYGLHANCYITKPVDFESFVRVVALIQEFWFAVVKLPPRDWKE